MNIYVKTFGSICPSYLEVEKRKGPVKKHKTHFSTCVCLEQLGVL